MSSTNPENSNLSEQARRHLWMHFSRMGSYETHEVPVMVRGEGAYVWDQHGKRYLDGLAGLFTSQLGHGRTELAEAGAKQASTLAYFPLWTYAHPRAIELAERLAGYAPATSTGSSSPPAAPRRSSRPGSWPASTSASPANPAHQGHQPRHRLPRDHHGRPVHHRHPRPQDPVRAARARAIKVPNTNFYRAPSSPTTRRPSASGRPTRSSGPSAGGARHGGRRLPRAGAERRRLLPAAPGYFERVREICDRHGVLLVSDEVICAFGRLGHWFGAERYGYQPDIITVAKG
jgi:hypothetical protein